MRPMLVSVLAFLPWLLSMYLLYWLEYSGTWTTETDYRDKLSVLILTIGLGASFLTYSVLTRIDSKQ